MPAQYYTLFFIFYLAKLHYMIFLANYNWVNIRGHTNIMAHAFVETSNSTVRIVFASSET